MTAPRKPVAWIRLAHNLEAERKVQRKFDKALKAGRLTDQLRMQMGNARALPNDALHDTLTLEAMQ